MYKVLHSVVIAHIKLILKQAMKARGGGVEAQLCSSFILSARSGQVVNATPWLLYRKERPGTHCVGGWVGPRAGLDGCRKSRPHQDSTPRPSSPKQVAIPTTLCRPFYTL